jgi:Mg2+ and Co2+ transporter CorA
MTQLAGTRDRVGAPRSQLTPGEGETIAAPGGPPSKWHRIGKDDGGEVNFSREVIEGLLARHEFFWLDLYRPDLADFKILSDSLKLHPLAIQDSEAFGQRAKIDEYDDFSLMVVYGASVVEDRLVEVHCFDSSRFLITIHRDDCPALADLRERCRPHYGLAARPSLLLYRVIDGLVSSLFPLRMRLTIGSTSSRTKSFSRPATIRCSRSLT